MLARQGFDELYATLFSAKDCSKMKLNREKFISFFLFAAIFSLSFEHATSLLLGFDTELKPHRLLALIVTALLFSYKIRLGQQSKKLFILIFLIYGFGYFLAMLWAILDNADMSIATRQAQLFLMAFLFYALPVFIVKKPDQIIRIAAIILTSAIVSSSVYILTFGMEGFYRFAGFFRNPNHYGHLIGLSLITAFYFIAWKQYRPFLFLPLLAWIFFGAILLIVSGSRGAIAASVIAMALLLYRSASLAGRGRSKRAVIGLGLVLSFTAALPYIINASLITDRVIQRFSAGQIETGAGRFDLLKSGLLAGQDSFFMGIGMGQYLAVHSYYVRQIGGEIYGTLLDFDLGVHNEFVNLLVEFGFFAFVAYCLVIFFLWRGIWKFGKSNRDWLHISALVEAYLIFNVLFSATQDMYTFSLNWLALGVCAALINIRERDAISSAR